MAPLARSDAGRKGKTMPMDVRSLIYFAGVVERRSFCGAAEAFAVEPSTVSRAVSALERELATPLLIRRRGGVVPTFEGEQLAHAAAVILDWLRRLQLSRPAVPLPAKRAAPLSIQVCRALLEAPVTLRTLSNVSTVVEEGSVSAAARRLNITQPTLGRRIAMLENWLGASLFERERNGSIPSALAHRLHAASLDAQDIATSVMRRGDVGFLHDARDLRLGAVMPAGADSSLAILLAHVIKRSGGRDWRRSVAVTTAAAGSLMEQVLAGELDAAIVDVADIPDAFRRVEIGRRSLHLIASTEASRPDDDTLDLLARTPIGLPMRGTGLRSATDHLLRLSRFAASRSIECGSIPVLMRLVIEGVCCAVLPRSALSVDEKRVRAFPLPGPGLVTSLIWTPAKDASPTVALLRELVRSEPFI